MQYSLLIITMLGLRKRLAKKLVNYKIMNIVVLQYLLNVYHDIFEWYFYSVGVASDRLVRSR